MVRRIFADYIAGASPRAIAGRLNAEQVPAPSGGRWYAGTINGNTKRGTGIVNNKLYVGRLVWNRRRYVKDPDTGRRVSRLNPREAWVVRDVPELAIVDDATWQAALERRRASALAGDGNTGRRLSRRNRPRRLLSGLAVCASCGGRMTMQSQGRLGCVIAKEAGACDNRRQVDYHRLERAVLDGLRLALAEPDKVAAYVEAWRDAERSGVASMPW